MTLTQEQLDRILKAKKDAVFVTLGIMNTDFENFELRKDLMKIISSLDEIEEILKGE